MGKTGECNGDNSKKSHLKRLMAQNVYICLTEKYK